jgi:uncharacterized protein YqcC (DUF446 family)
MTQQHISLAEILMDIEKELRELRLWEAEPLPPEALASQEPFAVDTMTFPQWLQFIFIPRFYAMIEAEMPLPTNCNIAPMAEEYFAPLNLYSTPLILHLTCVDKLLTQP